MRDLGHRLDIDDFQRRVGRALQEKGLGVLAHRVAPLREIGAVDQGRGDAVARQMVLDHIAAGAEQRLGGHDMVAGAKLAHERGGHRRHAGCGRTRGLSAFERAHARLEHGNRRITVARIDEARLLALEALLGARGIVVDVALGEVERLGILAELRAQNAGMHHLGFGAVALGSGHGLGRGHGGLLQPTKSRPEKSSAGLTRPRPFSNLFYVAASRPAQMTTG